MIRQTRCEDAEAVAAYGRGWGRRRKDADLADDTGGD